MSQQLRLPALSGAMEKANIVRWLKPVGEPFRAGDVLLEVETDKATLEVEAEADGVLAEILVSAGTADVPVDAPIAVLGGPNGAATAASDGAEPVGGPIVRDAGSGRRFASPLARRRAREFGIDLSTVAGSGPRGRIVEADVLRRSATPAHPAPDAALGAPAFAIPAPAAPEPLPAEKPVLSWAPRDADDAAAIRKLFATTPHRAEPVDGMRATIARRLSLSKQTVPHFYLEADIDVSELAALRERLRAEGPSGTKPPTINDFVVRAAAVALARVPEANAIWAGDEILRFDTVDIAVAVAVEGGLYTPVLRAAETLTLGTISRRLSALALAARERRLKPEDYSGGVASISNLGMHGVPRFSAILNPPQSAIFAIGSAIERIVAKGGAATSVPVMSVTLSVDHRVMDGATAAALLTAFRGGLERPLALLT